MILGILTDEQSWLAALKTEADKRNVKACALPAEANECLELLLRHPMDGLILDDTPKAWELLMGLERLPLLRLPHVCLRYETISDRLLLRFGSLVQDAVHRADTAEKALLRMDALLREPNVPNPETHAVLDRMVTELLLYSGVAPHLRGFRMLRSAVLMLLSEPKGKKLSVIHQIYPTIAGQYEATPSMVEHSMRHAIDSAWMRADLEAIETLFGYTVQENKGTPSNAAFLHTLADRVRIRYEKEYDVAWAPGVA